MNKRQIQALEEVFIDPTPEAPILPSAGVERQAIEAYVRRARAEYDRHDMNIKVGQVWQEVDPRQQRFARVLDIHASTRRRSVQIRTVVKVGDGTMDDPHRWEFPKHSRPTWCDPERFNGKRSGYALFEDYP